MYTYRVDRFMTLRLLHPKHAVSLYQCVQQNHAYLSQWLQWAIDMHSLTDVQIFVDQAWQQAKKGLEFQFGVWWNQQLVGVVSAHSMNQWIQTAEMGYWLAQHAQKKGLMVRAVNEVIRFLFLKQNLNRIEIRCATNNKRSQAVPKKLGFRLAGFLREAERVNDRLEHLLIFELLRKDWESRGMNQTKQMSSIFSQR